MTRKRTTTKAESPKSDVDSQAPIAAETTLATGDVQDQTVADQVDTTAAAVNDAPAAVDAQATVTSSDESAATVSDTVGDSEVEAIRVRSINERRCRAGFVFDREGQVLALGTLTVCQVEALEADPLLKVESCTLSIKDEAQA